MSNAFPVSKTSFAAQFFSAKHAAEMKKLFEPNDLYFLFDFMKLGIAGIQIRFQILGERGSKTIRQGYFFRCLDFTRKFREELVHGTDFNGKRQETCS